MKYFELFWATAVILIFSANLSGQLKMLYEVFYARNPHIIVRAQLNVASVLRAILRLRNNLNLFMPYIQ